jgi:hypothetical protein
VFKHKFLSDVPNRALAHIKVPTNFNRPVFNYHFDQCVVVVVVVVVVVICIEL